MRKSIIVFLALALVLTSCIPAQAATSKSRATLLVSAPTDSVFVGDTLQLAVTASDTAISVEGVTYAVSSVKLATVDANGVLTALGRGRLTVTAKTADGKVSGKKTITVTDRPESVSIKSPRSSIVVGRTALLTATVSPKTVANRGVIWKSSDETIATVTGKGQVKGVGPGKVTMTATSAIDEQVVGTYEMEIIRLATQVSLLPKTADVLVHDSLQLAAQFMPDDVSSKVVKYSSNKPKIATVDENGVVTGLKAGTATIKGKANDGSGKAGTMTVKVIQPVLGVHLNKTEVRIGVGSYSTIEAVLEPKDSSNKHMTWTTTDPSIATVKGDTNRVRVSAHAWGSCTITGVTEDGGFVVNLLVHGGSFRYANKVNEVGITSRGQPRLRFTNVSNLEMAEVRFALRGKDSDGEPIQMSTDHDGYTMYGNYRQILYPGDSTEHGLFKFIHPTRFDDLATLSCAITGFTTTDGFKYNINEEHWRWVDSK